jgi:hypothetical protein
MVTHACDPSFWRLRQENGEYWASLGLIARPYLKIKNWKKCALKHQKSRKGLHIRRLKRHMTVFSKPKIRTLLSKYRHILEICETSQY